MADLEDFADQGTPLLTDLNAAAPALGRLIEAQGTLADASRESFPSLGDALERGRPALIQARPLIQDLERLGEQAAPVSVNLDELTKSLDETGAIERLNDLLYYGALASTASTASATTCAPGLVTNVCSTYALEHSPACRAKFYDPADRLAAAARELGAANAARRADRRGQCAAHRLAASGPARRRLRPGRRRQREQNLEALRRRAERGRSPALDGSRAGARLPARG